MGKKSLKGKKEYPVLFPKDDTENQGQSLKELTIGSGVTIGRPSNRYFQYIYGSLDFFNLKISDLKELSELEGVHAYVTGIIKLGNGEEIAILKKKSGKPFYHNAAKLFIDRKKAVTSQEIVIT
ncbi:Hypothetical protein I595_1243 [Croceitalea dokdonensis DOKDO 023]|uniref:Uncharacterized protein n=1 Tax=Croceitalea dokdonensis DOKDO 023 TaxID=1300341 RepID=A0A0P7B1B8_9FLAO|nr:hypothetical protein [Croceitalea dokdonensis]KPM32816.1 Hypothetical protein I595_1243 [Croceitalea dokdonensis DOKDO 023]